MLHLITIIIFYLKDLVIIKTTINVLANNNLKDEINKEINKDMGKNEIIKINKKI